MNNSERSRSQCLHNEIALQTESQQSTFATIKLSSFFLFFWCDTVKFKRSTHTYNPYMHSPIFYCIITTTRKIANVYHFRDECGNGAFEKGS